ncbi:uncharacterized protein LOC103155303 [Poecilia formosa]|uniref:uncharacterized protein LOC103155303 n=1 Tax=Poecilia formosa TaxID=48698 RepID=UPI0007B7B0A2|nr:PREDICTED: uncharacterized protein LOC103155303 [Poecilia formosa]
METIELLVETLQQLSLEDFAEFRTLAEAEPSLVTSSSLEAANVRDVVDLMVKSSSGECVEAVRTVLMKMDRLDLVQRLSATDSGGKDELSVDEEPSLLDQRILKLNSDIKLLLETLEHLRDQELKDFKKILSHVYLMHLPRKQQRLQEVVDLQETADLEDTVIFIVQTNGEKSLVVTRDVLKNVGREDLAQRLLGSSSPSREMPLGKHPSALIHKVATMAAVKVVLLETLEDLNEPEFIELKLLLQFTKFQRNLPLIRWDELDDTNRTRVVDLLVSTCGKQSVEVIREVLLDLNRTDLALRLPETSSASKEKLPMKLNSAFLQKVEKLESVTELLLETLDELDEGEIEKFQTITQNKIDHQSEYIPIWETRLINVRYIVVVFVLTYFHQSVEKTMDVLKQMKKDDLIAKLSGRSSGPKEKPSAGQHRSALSHKVATMAAARQQLLETLDKLTQEEFLKFKESSSKFSQRLEFMTERAEVIDEMMEKFGQESVKMINELLSEINRKDLAENLQETEETSRSLDSVDCGSVEQDSSSWTKVDPELDGVSPDQDPTYSLQSAAGHFECSVSGLRWVCREKVGFRYRFCSWDGHMERMESRGFRPAGPLLDISVLTGKVMEVQLPHWVCTDDVPELLKNFAVLHVNDCGDVLEKVTRVTKTHVGLAEPVFSLLGDVIKDFFHPKVICNTLMYYQPKTSYLKMHVYLIPPDPALKQSIHREESSSGFEVMKKPHPDKYLKMGHGFTLKATEETARIQPPKITLRVNNRNFYEVFIESPDRNFNLELLQTETARIRKTSQTVWFCEIRKDDHPKSGSVEGNYF